MKCRRTAWVDRIGSGRSGYGVIQGFGWAAIRALAAVIAISCATRAVSAAILVSSSACRAMAAAAALASLEALRATRQDFVFPASEPSRFGAWATFPATRPKTRLVQWHQLGNESADLT